MIALRNGNHPIQVDAMCGKQKVDPSDMVATSLPPIISVVPAHQTVHVRSNERLCPSLMEQSLG